MPLTVKRYLLSRKTVLALLLLLFFSVVLSYAVPQQFSTPPELFAKWQKAHQAWLPATEFLGLHRLFTAPWFVALLFCFLVSLAVTTIEQLRLAQTKTFGTGAAHLEKHPWGYWGKFLLHLGILLTVASSLGIAATEKRGIARLEEGETLLPGSPWLFEEHGLLTGPLRLEESLLLDRVTPEFWPQGGVKNVTSEVLFIAPGSGEASSRTIAFAPILKHKGLRIYQEKNFGTAFHVMLTGEAGQQGVMVLDMPSPFAHGEASYGNFDFAEIPYRIKAKYYADAGQKTLAGDNPLLVIRLVDNTNTVTGELSLKKGGGGRLGPYQARLVEVKKWAGFIFLDTPFIPGVFLGFFIFILGAVLTYVTIPREFYCQRWDEGFRLLRKGPGWPRHSMAAYEAVMKRLKRRGRS
ncbi:MAG: cytochrome c biogenesis protein ResB [Pseudomonadota bacterium]